MKMRIIPVGYQEYRDDWVWYSDSPAVYWYDPREHVPSPYFRKSYRDMVSDMDELNEVRMDPVVFQIRLNAYHFRPEEITVKVLDNVLTIEGKHVDRDDKAGCFKRELKHRYVLPTGVDPMNVRSDISRDGVLTVTAPRYQVEYVRPPHRSQRTVPVLMPPAFPALEYRPSSVMSSHSGSV